MDTQGVDVERVRERLAEFIAQTRPINNSSSGYITPMNRPACGRDQALALAEVVHAIFERMYPEWRAENPHNKYDEFQTERDAAKKLLARLDARAETEAMLGGGDRSPRITAASLHPLIWRAAEAQWSTGHRHEAVLAAAKAVNSMLQSKLGRRDVSDRDLVQQAFSADAAAPGRPRLRFPHIEELADAEIDGGRRA